MKQTHVLLFLTILYHTSAMAQIDYVMHPDILDANQNEVRIDWILSSAKNCQIDFNHFVVFNNAIDDQIYGSKVSVELYRNNTLVRNFSFPTGDGIYNRIYLNEPFNIKKGESVYFIFRLQPVHAEEKYVFNIFQEKRDKMPVAKTDVTFQSPMPVAQTKPEEKSKILKVKAGGVYQREKRKERVNKTMTSLVNIISFML